MQLRLRGYVRLRVFVFYQLSIVCAISVAEQQKLRDVTVLEASSPVSTPIWKLEQELKELNQKVAQKLEEIKKSHQPITAGEIKQPEIKQPQQPANKPPIIGDYNPETVIKWSETSSFSFSVEAIIASTWILMVAAMPLVSIMLENESITKSQMMIFAIMWVVFLGGIYLFHNVILFQSVHFDAVRSLTVVESVYLLSQILTTVGYGDITPATPLSQVFVAFYVIFSLVVIANVVSEVSNLVSEHTARIAEEVKDHIRQVSKKLSRSFYQEDRTAPAQPGKISRQTTRHLTTFLAGSATVELTYANVIKSSIAYSVNVIAGVCFFHLYPGENKTWFEGVYMSIITLSTVGFGAVTPQTEAGKVFAAFWMLFGSASLVALVGSVTDLCLQIKLRERFSHSSSKRANAELFLEGMQDGCGKFDFFTEAMVFKGLVTEAEMTDFERLWSGLDVTHSGTVSKQLISEGLQHQQSPVSHFSASP